MDQILADVGDLRSDPSLFCDKGGPLTSLYFDEGSLHVGVALPHKSVRVSAVLVCPEAYPSTPALLTCDSDPEVAQQLSSAATAFQDAAPVRLLVETVLDCLGVGDDLKCGLEAEESDGLLSVEGSWGEEEVCSEYGECSDEDEDKEWTVELGRRQGCWARFEEERDRSGKGEAGVSAREEVAQHRQIFDSRAAYQMLSKELLGLLREQSVDLLVDAVNNDVYQWRVELAGFPPSSDLNKDIYQLQKRFSYSSIHLLITFKRGLHPFFPPCLEILRPRLRGVMAWALASHPMLNLRNWDPLMRQKDLIMQIKEFLANNARIDLDSPLNSIDHNPYGGYSAAERHISRLEGLCELPPRCLIAPEHKALYDSRNVVIDKDRIASLQQGDNFEKKSKKLKKEGKGPWAPGTGFGSRHTCDGVKDVWDTRKSKAAQQARDQEMENVLSSLADSLVIELGLEELDGAIAKAHASVLVKTLDDSCLLPFLWREIGNTSFTDMSGARGKYYLSIMKVIREISRPIASSVIFSPVNEASSSLCDAMSNLKPQALYYLKAMAYSESSRTREDPHKNSSCMTEASVEQINYSRDRASNATKDAAVEAESQLGLELATLVEKVADRVEKAQAITLHRHETACPPNGEGEFSDLYIHEMKEHQVDLIPDLMQGHLFAGESLRESLSPKERMVRLAREMAGLQSLLPVNRSSSILVRVDENKLTLWRALIFGPDDTPYSGGCFLFDIYFPPMYPNASPKVLIRTTGGGKVRFNPNLYACGKVCLSLLGTWSGGAGETWDASTSTCFQVLVSIQSLILVPDPYFNEPGYEDSMHTDQGKLASQHYNQAIRENCIHRGMIDYLRCTPPEFASPILAHFRMRREQILATCGVWLAEAQESISTPQRDRVRAMVGDEGHGQSHYSRLKSLVGELRGLLEKL